MKKTLTVNLNDRVFTIDEDAYELLDNYLQNLRIYFRNEEGSAEILADFEARIEELLSDRVRLGHNIINIEEVEKVIAQMGRPGDFGGNEEEKEKEAKTNYWEKTAENFTTLKKKLYRNIDDKMFGGVCSGIATYFDWNVTILRIIAAVLVFATSFWIVPVYLIMWMVVPEARTAEQKLEMQGKPITVENIGKTVAAGMENVYQTVKSNRGCLNSIVDFIAAFFKVCLVGLGCLIGIPVIFALMIIIVVLVATLLGVSTGILGGLIPWTNETFLYVSHPNLATAAGCLILGIPLIALVYSLIAHFAKLKPVHASIKWTGIIAWFVALILLACSGLKADWSKLNNHKNWNIGFGYDYDRKEIIHGDGTITDRSETLSVPIKQIKMTGALEINLQVEPDTIHQPGLIINGDSNILDKIDVQINGNELSLRAMPEYQLYPSARIIVRLQTTDLENINLSGATTLDVVGGLHTGKLDAEASGASKLNLYDIHTQALDVDVSGAAKVYISGDSRQADLKTSGASHLHAADFHVDTVEASTSGASTIECDPINYLSGKANGASKVLYKTSPKNKNISTSGAAKVQAL